VRQIVTRILTLRALAPASHLARSARSLSEKSARLREQTNEIGP
jgi:hypothetical protein